MSIDLCATVQTPASFADVVSTARATMCELLGLRSVPATEVFADPRYENGRQLNPGRRVVGDALKDEMIGGRMSAGHFLFRLSQHREIVSFFVAQDEGMARAVFSPMRTCVAVVLATALTLAAARHGCGEFLDLEIRMLEPGKSDPKLVVAHTRLAEQGTGFATQCEKYMRQFTRLGGWPVDVSLPSV